MSDMEQAWTKTMRETTNTCGRSEDLVAYIYNEATRAEANDFENHVRLCVGCKAEMEAFGVVRESIGEWRQQALGALPSAAWASDVAAVGATRQRQQRRGAMVAIREFFTLSPSWMRAATAAVALIFCVLAAIAVAYFSQQPTVVVVERPDSIKPETNEAPRGTTSESNAVDQNIEVAGSPEVGSAESPQAPTPHKRRGTGRTQLVVRQKQITPPRASEPIPELAAANEYLPFTTPSSEDKLPSLADLADEPNQD